MTQILDGRGKVFAVGQKIAKAAKYFQMDGLHVVECVVTKLNKGKIYLDDSRQPLRYPNRVFILGD